MKSYNAPLTRSHHRRADSAAASAERFRKAFESRTGLPPEDAFDDHEESDVPEDETAYLRAMMLGKIGRYPRAANAIFRDVRDDFGSVNERRLWRILSTLVGDGLVCRQGQGYAKARSS